jgi:hypothetical protein
MVLVKVWDDWKSLAHTIAGFVASIHPLWLFAVSLLYFGYEFFTSKTRSELVGDILEFCFGVALWSIIRSGWCLFAT